MLPRHTSTWSHSTQHHGPGEWDLGGVPRGMDVGVLEHGAHR